jgi:hypothetical protein
MVGKHVKADQTLQKLVAAVNEYFLPEFWAATVFCINNDAYLPELVEATKRSIRAAFFSANLVCVSFSPLTWV